MIAIEIGTHLTECNPGHAEPCFGVRPRYDVFFFVGVNLLQHWKRNKTKSLQNCTQFLLNSSKDNGVNRAFHSSVLSCLRPLDENEAGVDLVLIETPLFLLCEFLLISIINIRNFYQNKVDTNNEEIKGLNNFNLCFS